MRLDTRSDLRAPGDLASPAAPADQTRKPHAPTGSVWSTGGQADTESVSKTESVPQKGRRRFLPRLTFSKLTARVLAINLLGDYLSNRR